MSLEPKLAHPPLYIQFAALRKGTRKFTDKSIRKPPGPSISEALLHYYGRDLPIDNPGRENTLTLLTKEGRRP